MTIEEEIGQSHFVSDYHRVIVNVMFTSGWLTNQLREVLKPHALTHQQYNVLRILRGKTPCACTATDVKSVMIDKTPDLTRLLERLVAKGLVSRTVCENNRRKLDIQITAMGLQLLDKIQPEIDGFLTSLEVFTPEEAQVLSSLLDRLRSRTTELV